MISPGMQAVLIGSLGAPQDSLGQEIGSQGQGHMLVYCTVDLSRMGLSWMAGK